MHLPRRSSAASAPSLNHNDMNGRNDQPELHRLARRADVYIAIVPIALIVLICSIAVVCVLWKSIRNRRQAARAKSRLYEAAPSDDAIETQQQPSHALQRTTASSRRDNNTTTTSDSAATRTRTTASSANVDRQTSVRSVMTLPAYSAMASNNERILGRAGERDGIDIIVNMATEEEEEALRDEEMETMYQIRQTRRQQIAERDQRQAERDAARRRRDNAALEDIRSRTRAANNDTAVQDLQQQATQTRQQRLRSVSSVSYADLGVARHDGSRVDVSNLESEDTGLLSDAASLGRRSRDMTPSLHRRDVSISSFVSVNSDVASPAYPGSRSSSHVDVSRTTTGDGQLGSSPDMVEVDLGDEEALPPQYEEVSPNEEHSPPQYAQEEQQGQEGGGEDLQGLRQERQRSSSYVGLLPQIVIGPEISLDVGEQSARQDAR